MLLLRKAASCSLSRITRSPERTRKDVIRQKHYSNLTSNDTIPAPMQCNADASRKCKKSHIRHPLVNLDQARPKLGCCCNAINSRQITRCKNNSSDGKAVAEVSLVKWEDGSDGDLSSMSIDIDLLDLGDLWDVLLVDEDEFETRAVRLPFWSKTGAWDLEAEVDVLNLRLDVICLDGQGTEDFEVDGVEVGAGAWDDEVLVESGEGEVSCAGCQEWKSAGDLRVLLEGAVETVLFTLLSNH